MTPMPRRGGALAATALIWVGASMLAAAEPQKKPQVPPGIDPGGVAVAIIGEGIDYTRPEIAKRLARDGEGEIVGFDLVDGDRRPFAKQGNGAEVLIKHAVNLRLQVFRARMSEVSELAQAMAMAVQARAPVIVLGGVRDQRLPWPLLAEASTRFPEALFVAAGDMGRISDEPAARDLPNVIVVTSVALDGGRPVPVSRPDTIPPQDASHNAGGNGVDIAVQQEADEVPSVKEPPETRRQMPTDLAAAGVAALAARMVEGDPGLKGAGLKQRIVALAKPFAEGVPKIARYGWIDVPVASPALSHNR